MQEPAFTADELHAQIPRLRRYARALTGSTEAADDLVQDTLERAWRKRALFERGAGHEAAHVAGWPGERGSDGSTAPTEGLRAWLFSVMHNVFINQVRRQRPITSSDDPDAQAATATASGSSAETRVVLAELEVALSRLSDDQRAVLLLVALENLSYAQAADVLGVPIGTVMSRLSRARDRLRELLEDPSAPGRSSVLPLRRAE